MDRGHVTGGGRGGQMSRCDGAVGEVHPTTLLLEVKGHTQVNIKVKDVAQRVQKV